MRHCCSFRADEVYYLSENYLYSNRKLSIGFCPICSKPIAELYEIRFDGKVNNISYSGIKANNIVLELKNQILYSASECNYRKLKSKPFGWKYGINKDGKIKGKPCARQYACDFYGNKELIKTI